jgi:hypothetical protein
MDVKLPNGTIIKGVPEGTTKEQVMQKAIASGLATPADFGVSNMPADVIPLGETGQDVPDAPQPQRDLSIGDQIVGAGEAALTTATGLTGGTLGYLGGAARGLGQQLLGEGTAEDAQRMAEEGAAMLTYAPRTEAGQRMVGAIGEVAAALPAYAAATPVLMPAAQTARQVGQAVNAAPQAAVQAVREMVQPAMQADRSIGAAEIPLEQVRREQAAALPVPIPLTKGQATQDFAQQRFERETSKAPEEGAALRQRYTEQNQAVSQNIDSMLDMTGTQIGENAYKLETGNKVIKALEAGLEKEKQKVSNAYNVARARGETQEIIDPTPIGDYLKENVVDVTVAPVVGLVAREAERMGVASGKLDDGTFQLKPMTVEQSETLRQRVNELVDARNGQDLRRASQIKQLIDQAQEPVAGQAFQSARKMRRQLAGKFENLAIIDQLLDTKGQYADQRIAAENVVNRAVIGGSIEDVRNLRRVLTTSGEEGVQAWKEVRAATLRHLRDEVTKNVGRDPLGNPLISASQFDRTIKSLDQNGKLDLVFGKQYASQLRDLNEIVRDIYVSQPNAVNSSNTASVLLASIDMMASAGTGIPAPILSGLKIMRDKAKKSKVEKRVSEALEDKKK